LEANMPHLTMAAALLLLVLALAAPSGADLNDTAITISHPLVLSQRFPHGLSNTEALFGSNFGFKNLEGSVVYVTPKPGQYACSKQDIVYKGKVAKPVFLVDRGKCTFVTKVRNAQKLGAVAVLVVNNVCDCAAMSNYVVDDALGNTQALLDTCTHLGALALAGGSNASCAATQFYMADDQTGSDIVIPSFLIDFMQAQAIKDCLLSEQGNQVLLTGNAFKCAKKTPVGVSLALFTPVPAGADVAFEFWSDSWSATVPGPDIFDLVFRLREAVQFRPRLLIVDGVAYGCDVKNACGNQCTLGGLYCGQDPDGSLDSGNSGLDVVNEGIRTLCVWEQATKTYARDGGILFWRYLEDFAQYCPLQNGSITANCSQSVHDKIPGLRWNLTQACVAQSWGSPIKGHNVLLDLQLHDELVVEPAPSFPAAVVRLASALLLD
jgi:hypothetical protein